MTTTPLHDHLTGIDPQRKQRRRRHKAGREMYAAYQSGTLAQRAVFARWVRRWGRQEAETLLAAWRRNEL